MSSTRNSRRIRNYDPRFDEVRRSDSLSDSLTRRMRVAVRRGALTRQLARGVDPEATPELTLRAGQLTSDRRRRQMVRTRKRTIADARQPALTRAAVGIINRRAVIEAEDAMQELIERVRSDDAVSAKGMALAERIITDGVSSPLYNPTERGALRRQVLAATAAMDPERFELPIAA